MKTKKHVLVTPQPYLREIVVRKDSSDSDIDFVIESDDPGAQWEEITQESFEARRACNFPVKT